MEINIDKIPQDAAGLREMAKEAREWLGSQGLAKDTAMMIVLLEGLALLHERVDELKAALK